MRFILMVLVFGLLMSGCSSQKADALLPAETNQDAFNAYWNAGKAELTRYKLSQARYGQIHEGDAVMVFVTEPMLAKKQVKRESGEDSAFPVLKLNATRKFLTGVYDYSIMTSVFTRIDFDEPITAKVSFTAQEWCGHVYMQINHLKKGLKALVHSYFQEEADQDFNLPESELEDGLWTTIRIAPRHLPKGKVKMVPGLSFLRLNHVEAKAYDAQASLEEISDLTFGPDALLRYRVTYKDLDRTLDIFFDRSPPHRIMGWREECYSGWGESRKMMVTEAHRTHEIRLDYWNKNRLGDEALRQQLGLDAAQPGVVPEPVPAP